MLNLITEFNADWFEISLEIVKKPDGGPSQLFLGRLDNNLSHFANIS